jgi:predicted DNA-binding antitoxin AbrB/MazE fold protein
MTMQIEAVYENGVLRPDEPLDLEPNTRVRVTIETRSSVLSDMDRTFRGGLRELFGSVDLGYPTGADNESIDADLAREYGDPHEDAR